MGQPTPPGDIPLYEGLGAEWNDVVGALPEDQRSVLAPKIKERLDTFTPLKAWEDFNKSGITPEQVGDALSLRRLIEDNPRAVYDKIGEHLGITPQQAKSLVDDVQQQQRQQTQEDDDPYAPKLSALEAQVNLLAQIALGQKQQTESERLAAEEDAKLNTELENLKKKHGEFNEQEIVMRMLHAGMSAEQAFADYQTMVEGIRARRPAPMLMGSGNGQIPNQPVKVTDLSDKDRRSYVAQMMAYGIQQQNQ